MTGILGELKRRNVFRVAAAYAVGGWLLTEVLSVMLQAFDAPDWVLKVFIGLLLLGFPIALTLSWVYEITSDGVKRESEVDRSESVTHATGRRLNMLTIALIVFAVGFVIVDRVVWTPGKVDTHDAAVDADTAKGDKPGHLSVAKRSVAVLPFVNMSNDAANEYFSDGISEEILNELARIPELKVASRTSSFQFKGENRDIGDIGNHLKVANILEGSVRKAGNRVRITAQLISIDDGYHLWSDTYDRELNDIFAIQDEIAKSVADAMRISLNIETSIESRGAPTADMRAYDLYLLGLHHWNLRGFDNLKIALEHLEQSVEIDPGFARAWLGLGLVYSVISGWGDYPGEKAAQNGLAAADRVLSLDPSMTEAYALRASALGKMYRWDEAIAEYRKSIRMKPDFASAHQWMGTALLGMGQFDEALDSIARAYELDPDSRIIASNYAMVLFILGDYEKALQVSTALITKYPDYSDGWEQHFFALYHMDRFDDAYQASRSWALTANKPTESVDILFAALTGAEVSAEQREKLIQYDPRKATTSGDTNLLNVQDKIVALALLGETEAALDTVDRDVDGRHEGVEWTRVYSLASNLWCEPRYIAAMERLNLPPARSAGECATLSARQNKN